MGAAWLRSRGQCGLGDAAVHTESDLEWDFSSGAVPNVTLGAAWHSTGFTADIVSVPPELSIYDSYDGWLDHLGLIGVDNTNGTKPVAATLSITVAKIGQQTWDDYVAYTSDSGTTITPNPLWGPPWPLRTVDDVKNGDHYNAYYELFPNPQDVTFTWYFYVPVGKAAFIDSYLLSTTVVPLPPALWSGLAGLMMVFALAARRRRRQHA